jgi:ubiquinone/menaquinone biosynthesis C-methylase UbiE
MPSREIQTQGVSRPGAFLGQISSEVRSIAAEQCRSATGQILDVGCGNGLLFAELGQLDAGRVGVDERLDLLSEGVSVLRDNDVTGVFLTQSNAQSIPFPDGTFDKVLFLNTFMVLHQDKTVSEIVAELARVTAPGGRIIADIRNNGNLILRTRYWINNRLGGFVARGYDIRQISGLFEAQNCKIGTTHSIGPWLPFGPSAIVLEAEKLED